MIWHKAQGAGGVGGAQPDIIGFEVGAVTLDPSVNTPSGIVDGNLLVWTGAISSNEWQSIASDVSAAGFTMRSTNFTDTNPSCFVATRVVNGSEAASYSLNSNDEGLCAMIALNLTFDVAGAFTKDSFDTSFDITGITVANAGSYLFTVGGIGDDSALTVVSGTELFNTGGVDDPTLAVHYEIVSAGASGTRTITRTSTTGGIGGVLFAAY